MTDKPAAPFPVKAWPMPSEPWPLHITTVPHAHVMKVSRGTVGIDLQWVDTAYNLLPCPEEEVTVDSYDPSVVRFSGLACTPLRPGTTFAVARWQGRSVEFPITVQPEDMPDRDEEKRKLVGLLLQVQKMTLCLSQKEIKQIRGRGLHNDGSWFEVVEGITLSGYDESLISAAGGSDFIGLRPGSTRITAACQGFCLLSRLSSFPEAEIQQRVQIEIVLRQIGNMLPAVKYRVYRIIAAFHIGQHIGFARMHFAALHNLQFAVVMILQIDIPLIDRVRDSIPGQFFRPDAALYKSG